MALEALANIKADLKIAVEQIATATTVEELRDQLLNNLVPVVDGVVDATAHELVQRDEVILTLIKDVEELQDDMGDVLMPETAERFLGVLTAGDQIAKELEALLKASKDEITKKRIAPLLKNYKQGAIVVRDYIAEITIPVDPEEPDDDEEDDDPEAGEIDPAVGATTDDDEYEDGDEEDDDDDDEDDDEVAAPGKAR